MTFNASTDTPSTPPPSGFFLIGMKSDRTGDVFNGSDFLTKDASGNFPIGTTSAQARFEVRGIANATNFDAMCLSNYAGTGANSAVTLHFDPNGAGALARTARIASVQATAGNYADLRFFVCASGAPTEALRLTTAGHAQPGTDNVSTLGTSSRRWSLVYAATGTINTSDGREKDWIAALGDHPARAAYLAAAREIEKALGLFQWGEAVSAKGADGARWHFGAVAQTVIMAFQRHGLEEGGDLVMAPNRFVPDAERPALRHAMLCFDTWEEEREPVMKTVRRTRAGKPVTRPVPTGETRVVRQAGNRFGLRIDQLLAFLAAANGIMRRDLEARIATLEAQ